MSKQNPDDPPQEIAAGTVIDGRYRIVRPLGHGGNGMVHEVVHLMTGRHLALKSLLDETGLGRLEQEARASSLMKNGHTAKITDMGTNGPAGPYLVMELLEGQSLRGLLDEAGQLPLELTVNIALQVCECLTEAHGHGIIHRDLKPENVFLCSSNWPGQYDVKILDFGIVKIDGEGAIPKSSLTRTGSTVGTPYYMSLEQLRNSSAVDVRADVYSLGVVIYECLSGRKPFQAETIGDLVFALCSGPPTHLGRLRPDLPADVCDMVMRTLSINRDDRPPTMTDFAMTLLPQGNAAFGMWIRSDGRPQVRDPQRSLSQGAGAITPSSLIALGSPLPQGRPAMSSLTQPPPPGSLMPLPPVEAPPAAMNFKATTKMAPHEAPPKPPKPQRPQMDSEPPGGRDTPTEMYVKGAHDGPSLDLDADPRPPRRDRDTPTSAFRADLPLPEPRAERPFLQTLKSPGSMAGESGSGIPAPRFGGPVSIEESSPSNPWTEGVPNHDPMTSAPTLDPRSLGAIPAARLSAPNLILSTLPLIPRMDEPFPGPAAPPNKPAWQASLDRALTRVGSLIEDTLKRFRAAPQQTQLAIAIAAAGAVLLILSLFLLLMIH
jgi:eukaryotic-like serine/threonine-protein kinase